MRAARLVQFLSAADLPPTADGGFPLPDKLTVTQSNGGQGFSTVPDHAVVSIDARLTDVFDTAAAEEPLNEAAADLNTTWPLPRPTTVETVTNWPPFLASNNQPAAALLDSATAAGLSVRPKVAGPSNIGNYLARRASRPPPGSARPMRVARHWREGMSGCPALRPSHLPPHGPGPGGQTGPYRERLPLNPPAAAATCSEYSHIARLPQPTSSRSNRPNRTRRVTGEEW